MKIEPLALLQDNYAWALVDEARGTCVVVDPSEGAPVVAWARERGLEIQGILATHHHWDHTQGNEAILSAVGEIPVWGSAHDREQSRVPGQTVAVADGDRVEILGETADCLVVPGHTLGAVAFHFPRVGAVFTGDTLFTAGCGRLFEGTPEQMWSSLRRLRDLPPATQLFCGHEYTQKNLSFAASVLPEDEDIRLRSEQVDALRAQGLPTVPSTLEVECRTNPFLRADDPAVQRAVGCDGDLATFTELRRRRDVF